MSLNKLSLLVVLSLAFSACDDSATTPPNEGGTAAGTTVSGTMMPPAGTMMDAGTMMPPAGTMMPPAGTMVDAGTMMPPAGTMMDERIGMGDTDALACTGTYCPSARLSGLTLPADAAAATTGGCRLAGSANGTSLNGLLAFAGDAVDTNSFVQPDPMTGEIKLVLLNHLKGWDAGSTGNAAGDLLANFYTGVQAGEAFEIDPVSLHDDGTPYISFPGTTVTDGLLRTPTSTFTVNLPILDGVNLGIRLDQAKLEGDVTVDATGFNLSAGVLGGYLTKDGVMELINGLLAACTSPTPPAALNAICPTLVGLGSAEAAFGLVSTFLTFDTHVEDGAAATSCANADCNALSVCLLVEMSSASVTGVAMP